MADVKVEALEDKVKELTINLKYEFQTNGKSYGPGKVTVSEDMADDLIRRETEHDANEKARLVSREIIVDISKVTGQVLSGAGQEVPAE